MEGGELRMDRAWHHRAISLPARGHEGSPELLLNGLERSVLKQSRPCNHIHHGLMREICRRSLTRSCHQQFTARSHS